MRRGPFIHSVVEQSTDDTHRPMPTVDSFLTLQHVAMGAGNHDLSVENTAMDIVNN